MRWKEREKVSDDKQRDRLRGNQQKLDCAKKKRTNTKQKDGEYCTEKVKGH